MSLNSIEKVNVVKGVSAKSVAFATQIQEDMKSIHAAVSAIALPATDRLYNGLVNTVVKANLLLETTSSEFAKMCDTWGSRAGIGDKAVAAFEEAKTSAKGVIAVLAKPSEITELSDGLHENLTPETIGALTNAMSQFLETRATFIYGVASCAQEAQSDPETVEVINTIGAGMETFTNSVVSVIDSNKSDLMKMGISFDEAVAATKASAANVAEVGDKSRALENAESIL